MKTIRNKREKKTNKTRKKRIYTNIEYNSKDGMLIVCGVPVCGMYYILSVSITLLNHLMSKNNITDLLSLTHITVWKM